eukprot:CAMPEP_0204905838 /NCGR_PEP_ID=MMETSP1397-20131031/5644_1 /ASSEMBLY_ACC=CAM_ASM_000891 /TAXON_ID=49980 /ORGANISM="Climacostomum Climacostomum virens, Strain Stock W-24" /LENGTH=455 /DNA_ID=CAMNT_0052074773 /DNA_START=79 /DNA_END=1443 /DNA_ORIENTATION=-
MANNLMQAGWTLLLAASIASVHAGLLHPEQIKLAWTENENEMRVSWVTYLQTSSLIKYRPIICSAESEFVEIEGHSKSFNEGDDTLVRIQYIHTGVMTNITAGCFYEYKVGNHIFWSDLYTFSGRTPDYQEPYDDYTKPTSIVLFGDLGTGKNAQATKHLLYDEVNLGTFDHIIHIGDFAYDLHDYWGEIGDKYLRMIEPVVAHYPYMTIPGNHENHNNVTHYKARFQMPNNGANQGTGYFYSYNVGPAHIVLFNTEIILSNSHVNETLNELNWLKEDLAKANEERDLRPWLILGSHHPLYCSVDWNQNLTDSRLKSNSDCGVDTIKMQAILEDLFYDNGVDLYFQAHVHNYERDAAIYKNLTVPSDYDSENLMINPKAPIYITSGNAGNEEGHNDLASPTPQLWARFLSNDYGYGRIVVHNATHLYWEQISAPQRQVIDHLWIVKDKPSYAKVN